MRSRKDDYYLKNGSLDLTMLDEKTKDNDEITQELQISYNQGWVQTNIERVCEENYESRYINLKIDKIPDITDDILGITNKISDSMSNMLDNIERTPVQSINEIDEVSENFVRPYMSEEIHSVLKEMGEYLLEGDGELAATLETSDYLGVYDSSLAEVEEFSHVSNNNRSLQDMNYISDIKTKDMDSKEDINESYTQQEIDRQSFRLRQYEILEGKVLTKDVISSSNEYIGRKGEVITKYTIQLAEEKRCMIKLIMRSE